MNNRGGGSRIRKVADQIQRELAILLQREIKDPRIGMVTVSAVKVSRDFSYADVYITVMEVEQADAASDRIEALTHSAGYLRSMLAKLMRLRTVPKLRFHYDETLVRGRHLSSLIDEAVSAAPHDANSQAVNHADNHAGTHAGNAHADNKEKPPPGSGS